MNIFLVLISMCFVSWYMQWLLLVSVTYLTEIIPRKGRGIAVQSLEVCAQTQCRAGPLPHANPFSVTMLLSNVH